ncbi:MAG TPA: SpoIIE family protein phosphatase, partial [Gemmatimonadales bacterium]|nr:SpoIIE family protein phosphatase [Gemmatimonadales bacterium]
AASIQRRQVPWSAGEDLLVLWTDGLVDARDESGEAFGEQRLLAAIAAHRNETPEELVHRVLEEADQFGGRPTDDRTLLVLRI